MTPPDCLPKVSTRQDYVRIYRDADVWMPAMRAICQRHGLDADQLEFAPPGTHVVFRAGPERYIKLFSPLWSEDFVPERLVLRQLSGGTGKYNRSEPRPRGDGSAESPRSAPETGAASEARFSGRADLPVPQLVAEGEIEGWPYIVVTAVAGVPLYQVWSSMDTSNKEHIAARCGELMASLHATSTEGLEAIAVDWPTFVERQVRDCIDRLTRADIGEQWVRSVQEFLDDLPPLFEPGFRPVLLSADVTDEHILVSERGGRWELTGFIDFGDAMLGHPLYEFAAPGCCVTRGSPHLQRAMLLAYGYSDDQLDATLAKQLMAYILIHRFVNISDILDLFGPQGPTDFDALRKALWSLG